MKYAIFSSVKSMYLIYAFFLGIVIGTLFLNLIVPDYFDEIGIFSNYFVDKFNAMEIDKLDLFNYTLISRIKEMILLLVFSFTVVNVLYNVLYCSYLGFSTGIFISSITISNGIKGIWIYIVSIFPHYIVYIFLVVFTISKSIQINQYIYHKGSTKDSIGELSGKNIVFNIMLIVIIILIVCVLEALLEVYVNISLLKNILQ